jgi:hypothetical protein
MRRRESSPQVAMYDGKNRSVLAVTIRHRDAGSPSNNFHKGKKVSPLVIFEAG